MSYVIFIVIIMLIIFGAFPLYDWSERRFERKRKQAAEERYQRTLELAKQGKCPYPPEPELWER